MHELFGAASLQFDDIKPPEWPSLLADQLSSWRGHVSFGNWIVTVTQPRLIVELGTFNGVSFSSFCDSVTRNQFATKCFAVDTWEGDEHAGRYGDEVYENLSRFIDQRFSGFSTLMRCYFDQAANEFDDGSIDILHIDGLHTYEAVAHDFETWKSKLSDKAVVLFHDTQIRDRDFGVWKLWSELSEIYPSFEFLHSAGLGVLAVGPNPSPSIVALCSTESQEKISLLRHKFAQASSVAQQTGLDAFFERNRLPHNIGAGCHTFQSSVFSPLDKNRAHYLFHTNREAKPWWVVDLATIKRFDEIVIYNRVDGPCAPRSRNIQVLHSIDLVHWTTIYEHDGTPFGEVDGIPLVIKTKPVQARFVRLQLPGTEYLHLKNVEIYHR